MQSSQLKQPSKFTQARYSRVEDKRKPKGSKKDPRQSIACSQLESQFSKQAPFDEHIFSMQDITFRDNAQKAQVLLTAFKACVKTYFHLEHANLCCETR